MTNTKVKCLKTFFKILEWSLHIGLLFGSGFFVDKVSKAYQSQETSIKMYSEPWITMTPPTITFCFKPPVKKSVLQKYNLTFYKIVGYGDFETKVTLMEESF